MAKDEIEFMGTLLNVISSKVFVMEVEDMFRVFMSRSCWIFISI